MRISSGVRLCLRTASSLVVASGERSLSRLPFIALIADTFAVSGTPARAGLFITGHASSIIIRMTTVSPRLREYEGKTGLFFWELLPCINHRELLTLQGLRPARSRRPGSDSAVVPVYKKCERGFCTGNIEASHAQGWRKGGNNIFKNRFSTEPGIAARACVLRLFVV